MDKSKETNNAIATLLVSYMMKKFNLDTLYYGMVYGLVVQLLVFISSYEYVDIQFNWYYLWLLPIVCGVSYIGYYIYYYYYVNYKDKTYLNINIYDEDKIQLYMKYVRSQKLYYDQSVDTNYGDFEAQAELLNSRTSGISASLSAVKMISQGHNMPIHFKDLYLNMEGYYMWTKTAKNVTDNNKEKQINVQSINVKIIKDKNININDFFTNIQRYLDTYEKTIELKYVKILKDGGGTQNHIVTFYSGIKQPFEILEEKFMKPFFHQEKDRLWSVIKNVCLNPDFYSSKGQSARISLLLYGPSGTGKSSYIYRLAQCFSRHIISLDLRIASKINLYQILQRPMLPNMADLSYKDVIYLFEEFDIAIKELAFREKKNNEEIYYQKIFESLDKEEQVKSKKNYNEFCIRDLLEIFQGPIPFESTIMMATTNKYDEIKECCPELFRPGRLTPVYFGYIDKTTLQDISMYFFNKKINGYLPDVLTVPTSQIIELVFESLNYDHDYFVNALNKLMQ